MFGWGGCLVELNLWCALRIEPVCFDICVEQREFAWRWGVWSTSKATCCTSCIKGIFVLLIIWTCVFYWKFMRCHFCLWNHYLWDGSFFIIFEIRNNYRLSSPFDLTQLLKLSPKDICFFLSSVNFYSLILMLVSWPVFYYLILLHSLILQVFYYLGELNDSLSYALGAGPLFDVSEDFL